MKNAFHRQVIIRLLILALSAAPVAALAQERTRSIGHLFSVENFERDGDGFSLTVANNSNRGFADFLIIVLGRDIHRVTVYRREIHVSEMMEGRSERTFHLDSFDDRVFRVRIEVLSEILPGESG
ncbi:MAG TPA: hypothetical protein VLT88_11680 [Desulfosarcina sp.]|nr:hypothetical protein [Desulfosarcina sp.]